jgi:hypothetical protein
MYVELDKPDGTLVARAANAARVATGRYQPNPDVRIDTGILHG